MSRKKFAIILAAIMVVAFGIRITYVLAFKQGQQSCSTLGPKNLCGDAFVYHEGANLLADGKGFIGPPDYFYGHKARASADHPPLYVLYLAAWSVLRARSVLWHQFASVLLGLASVALTALFGREIFDQRTGLVAAGLVAVYPLIWVNDALVMSETIALTCTVGLVWMAYRLWRSPSTRTAISFGVMGGLTALTRAELVLYVPIVALIAVMFAVRYWRKRLKILFVVGLCSAAIMAPWVVRNLTTFKYPVTLSTGLGITLTYTNCYQAYHGDLIGYWYFPCIYPIPVGVDQSEDEKLLRKRGLDYMFAHKSELPKVMVARLGRQWLVFRPRQMINLDTLDSREKRLSEVGGAMYFAMIPLAVAGAVVLRRRRTHPLTPLLTVPVIISLAAMMTYGSTRFRVPAEFTLVILTSIGGLALLDRLRTTSSHVEVHDPGGSL